MELLSPRCSDPAGRIHQLVGPAVATAPFGTYVVAAADPAASLGRQLERDVFGDVFGNSEELLAHEYDRYEASSVFVLVVDHRRRLPAGVMRLVLPSPSGLKTLEDIRRLWGLQPDEVVGRTGVDPQSALVWDLATLAVGREYRGAATQGLVSSALWQAVGVMADRCQVDLLVAIIDVPVYRLLQLKLGRAFETVAGLRPQPYLDSPASLPVWCRPDHWRARFADADPALYGVMIEGRGLEAAVRPPDWDEASATARRSSLIAP